MARLSKLLLVVGAIAVAGVAEKHRARAGDEKPPVARPPEVNGPAPVAPSSKIRALYSQVDARVAILSLLPNGARVKQGQVVCELDASRLKDRLANQEIVVQRASAIAHNARLTREVEELAVQEA